MASHGYSDPDAIHKAMVDVVPWKQVEHGYVNWLKAPRTKSMSGAFHVAMLTISPQDVHAGGIYLKDAAVMAGLGCIGKSNILVTPEYGPRIRLRALTLSESFPSTGPSPFNPCAICDGLCRKACPQNAFGETIYQAEDYNQDILPGRDGNFSRPVCGVQMDIDNDEAVEQDVESFEEPVKVIKYCRKCELTCPVGKR